MDVIFFEHEPYYKKFNNQGENVRQSQFWEELLIKEPFQIQPTEFQPTSQSLIQPTES